MADVHVSFRHRLGPFDGQFDDARFFRRRRRILVDELLGDADEDAVVFEEDFVGGDGVEAREVLDVTGSDVETGAVPRTTDSAGRISA